MKNFDAIVIGAGIVGASVALELARSGRTVAVIDRNSAAGAGSTSASSAIVRFNYSTYEGVALSWEAKHCWADWANFLGHSDPTGMIRYIKTGGLVMDAPALDLSHFVELYDAAGIPCELLDADALVARFPYFDNGFYHPPKALDDDAFWAEAEARIGAFFTPEGGFIDDPSQAAKNLLHAALMEGAESFLGCSVSAVMRDGNRVTGVRLDDGRELLARHTVNAAGPASPVINEMADALGDFNIRTKPLRQEVHHVPGPSAYRVGADAPFVNDGDLGTYFRPEPGGEVLVGGLEPDCDPIVWLDDADDFDAMPTGAVYEAQATRLARRLPEASVPARVKGIVGVYDVSDDWLPIYDRTGLDGYFVAIGTSGNQFKNGPVVGQLLRAIIEATEAGQNHDTDPVVWKAPYSGSAIDLSAFSRLREMNPESSYSVMG